MILRTVLAPFGALTLLLTATEAAESWCVVNVQRGDVLQIRNGPSPAFGVVAAIPPTACGVRIVAPCAGPWCPVEFQGRRGWSNAFYLVSEITPIGSRLAAERRSPPRPVPTRAPQSPPQKAVEPPSVAAATAVAPPAPAPAPAPERPAQARVAASPPVVAAAQPPPASPPAPERPAEAPRQVTAAVSPPKEAPPSERVQPAAPPVAQPRDVCVRGIPKGDTLKVRASASPAAELRYGFLPDTCGVKITAECKDGWCPVEYRGYRGWAEEKNLR